MVWGSWSSAATQTEGNPKVKKRDRKMKRTLLTLVTTSLVLVAEAAETNELEKTESGGLTVEASVDVLSDYIWRGTICNGNPVWQPSATIGYDAGDFGTVSANVWSSFDLTHKRGTATNTTSRTSAARPRTAAGRAARRRSTTRSRTPTLSVPLASRPDTSGTRSRTTTDQATKTCMRPSRTRMTS